MFSTGYSDVDENGIMRMMLCHVIMGNAEAIPAGSKQFQPSNKNFDSGVDDLQNPKHYVVWEMNVNTHIYPEYVVTIKVPSKAKGNSFGFLFCFCFFCFFFPLIFFLHNLFVLQLCIFKNWCVMLLQIVWLSTKALLMSLGSQVLLFLIAYCRYLIFFISKFGL